MPMSTMFEPRPQPRSGKSTLVKVAAAFGALALVGVAAVVVSHCGSAALGHHQLVQVQSVEPAKAHEQLPAILRRDYSDESISATLESYGYSAPANDGSGNGVIVSSSVSGAVVVQSSASIDPVSTTTPVSVTTENSALVVPPSEYPSCTNEAEETVTVTVTMTEKSELPLPAYGSSSSSSGSAYNSVDATVTGNPTTLTTVQTDVSYTSTSRLPDATVSANPSTITNLETDTRYTSSTHLPDVTVSGEPVTLTTVITNTAGKPMTTLTLTSMRTVLVTVTHSQSSSSHDDVLASTSTSTEIVTVTDGAPVTSTTTVMLPPAASSYGHGSLGLHGTGYGGSVPVNVTSVVSPVTTHMPPVISVAGTVNACCTFSIAGLVIAAMMSVYFF